MENLVWHWADGVEVEKKRNKKNHGDVERLSAILGNIFYNLQHIHIGENLWISDTNYVSNRVYGRVLKLRPHVQTCSLVSVKCSVKGRVSRRSPWQQQKKKNPCWRVVYNWPSSPTWQLLFLTVHHGSNPAIPCDPHNSGKRGGRMTSCLPLDSEAEGTHKKHEWGLQSL